MKNKKGFTLVEIIAVIVILIVVTLIAVPAILKMIKRNKETAYDAKLEFVLKQARQYAQDNNSFIMDSDRDFNGYVCNVISVQELYNAGYLKEYAASDGSIQNITNPNDGSSLKDVKVNVYIKAQSLKGNDKYVGPIQANYRDKECVEGILAFDYTGEVQKVTLSEPGYYKLEVWGAQGGDANYDVFASDGSTISNSYAYNGGTGGYSVGIINISSSTDLYVAVGGKGTSVYQEERCYSRLVDRNTCGTGKNNVSRDSAKFDYGTGFNGGSHGSFMEAYGSHGGGGGATHIALSNGLLKDLESKQDDVLIVAGGGGGAHSQLGARNYGSRGNGYGGDGGGYIGGAGRPQDNYCVNYGLGGAQDDYGKFRKCSDWQTQTTSQPYFNATKVVNSNTVADKKFEVRMESGVEKYYTYISDVETEITKEQFDQQKLSYTLNGKFLPDIYAGFGQGAGFSKNTTEIQNFDDKVSNQYSGGGGGFYGGGSGLVGPGGGGSGYIGNSLLINKAMYCFNCEESSNVNTKTSIAQCTGEDAHEKCTKKGDGYARISYIGTELD